MRLEKKVAIITGAASRGIGRAIAVAFVHQGARLILADLNEARLNDAVAEVGSTGGEVRGVTVDISDPLGARAMVDAATDRYGRVDILVHCAAVIARTPFLEAASVEWDRMLAVNVRGAFICAQAAARKMADQKSGKIILFASDAALVGIPPLAAYAASKAAVIGLMRTAAVELAEHNIQVNAIAPGTILTDMTRERLSDPEWRDQVLSRFPLGRLGKPADVTGAALFLASSESDWMTGHCLVVDGGHTAR